MHVRWVVFLQKFSFIIKHKSGHQNRVADALSRCTHLLTALQTEITRFEELKDTYMEDSDFSDMWRKCVQVRPVGEYSLRHGYLFKSNSLCITQSSLWMQLIKEAHCGGLAAQLGQQKATEQL